MTPTILAYSPVNSVRPGDRVEIMASVEGASEAEITLLRLRSPATPATGPGFQAEQIAAAGSGNYPVRHQPIGIGSFGIIHDALSKAPLSALTLQAFVWATLPGDGRQCIMGAWNEEAGQGFCLALDEAGHVTLRLGDGGAPWACTLPAPLPPRQWHLVSATFDGAGGTVRLVQEPVPGTGVYLAPTVSIRSATHVTTIVAAAPLTFAAWSENGGSAPLDMGAHYNGKIDRPRIFATALGEAEITAASAAGFGPSGPAALLGAWDFSLAMDSDAMRDLSANGRHGRLVNLPARVSTGANWTGATTRWIDAPDQYGAVHFHDDDLYDAGWAPTATLEIPLDARSGVYAARVSVADKEFFVPLYVRPPKGQPTAEVAYLASTATYMAYSNYRSRVTSPLTDIRQGRLTVVDEVDLLMLSHPEIGISAYDAHRDGSAVHHSSRLRPVTNYRPVGGDIEIAFDNFAPDLLIIDWLEENGTPYDVLTDEDLHSERLGALDGYRVIVTGTHPEYHSTDELDAIEAFVRRGGRLIYTGGNGFFWRIGFNAAQPGAIELRRAESPIERWNPGPGQAFQSNGELGGLWKDIGRPANRLVGIGMNSQGFDISTFYRRQPGADDPRAAFIFHGVDDEVLGDFGLLRGGAAGIELDWADFKAGTPPHALILASSDGHSNVFEPSIEVVPLGAAQSGGPRIGADMVFFECPGGGAVFSTGSIAYAGSLSHNGYDNSIARMTANVLRRFLDPAPFQMP